MTLLLQIVTSILSAVAAVAAVISAVVAYAAYRNGRAPEVIAYLEHDGDRSITWFYVKNIGEGVAYDVTVDASKLPVDSDVEKLFEKFTAFGFPLLAPDASRRFLVHVPDRVETITETIYPVVIRYSRKSGGKKTEAVYPLDYCSFHRMVFTDSDERLMLKSVQGIEKGLSNIARSAGTVAGAVSRECISEQIS